MRKNIENKTEYTLKDKSKLLLGVGAIVAASIWGYQPKEVNYHQLPYQGHYTDSGEGIHLVFDEYNKEERMQPAKVNAPGMPRTTDTKKPLKLYKKYEVEEITPNLPIFKKRLKIYELQE